MIRKINSKVVKYGFVIVAGIALGLIVPINIVSWFIRQNSSSEHRSEYGNGWWKEINVTLAQKRKLDEIDKHYREQAKRNFLLWRQKLRELQNINWLGADRESVMRLVREAGEAYTKFEMAQALRRIKVYEALNEEQKSKLKRLIHSVRENSRPQSTETKRNDAHGCCDD